MFNLFKKMNFIKKMSKELGKQRTIDISVEKTLKSVKSGYRIVPAMEIKAWKAYLVVTFVAGFAAALIWSAYVSIYPVSKADENAQVTLSTSAVTASHKVGDEFPIQIILNTAGKNIVAVQAIYSYDKNTLQVISADISGSSFNNEIKNTIDANQGQGFLALAKATPGVNGATVKVATVNLKALADVSEPTLRLKLDTFNAVSDSAAMLDDGLGTNVLQKVESMTLNVAPTPTPTPTPTPAPAPTPAADFSTNSIASLADTIVRMSWTEGSYEDKNYIIERKTGKADFSKIAEAGSSERIFIDRSVRPSTTYLYRICQTDDSGTKDCAEGSRITTQKKKKIETPRLVAGIENGKVRLTWLPTYTADFGIFVQRKVDKQKKFTTLTVINSDSGNSYLDESVSAGQKITYRILVAASKKSTQKSKGVKIIVP
jgi:hypothetical protein